MSLIRQFAIRNELLYSGFVLPNVQIFFVQKISFATFGVSIDDFFTRYAGLGYSLYINFNLCARIRKSHTTVNTVPPHSMGQYPLILISIIELNYPSLCAIKRLYILTSFKQR